MGFKFYLITATRYGLDDPGFESSKGKKFVSSPEPSRLALGSTQPPIQRVLGGGGSFLVGKRPLPRLRMSGSIPLFPTPRIIHHDVSRDNITFFKYRQISTEKSGLYSQDMTVTSTRYLLRTKQAGTYATCCCACRVAPD